MAMIAFHDSDASAVTQVSEFTFSMKASPFVPSKTLSVEASPFVPSKLTHNLIFEELAGASTDTGGEDNLELVYTSAAASSDDSCSDSDAQEEVSDCIAYSMTFMLAMRMAVGQRSPATLGYGTKACPPAETPKQRPRRTERSERSEPIIPKAKTDDEKIARSARSILNKLTIEKFDTLYDQLVTCGFQTPEHISILMREIFEKATMEHHFIEMYADLCVRLEVDPRIIVAVEAEEDPNNFRRLLLTQCQVAFEQLLEPWTPIESGPGDDDLCALRKRRAIGNVKLVAQLMVRGMLSSRLLCSCADELIRGYEVQGCPESLESLAVLLTVAGPAFDVPSFKYFSRLEMIFTRVRELAGDRHVASRVRFLLRDVLDLRKATWSDRARPPAQTAKPMKLEEVREKASEKPKSKANDVNVQRLRSLQSMIGDGSSGNKKDSAKTQQRSDKRSNVQHLAKESQKQKQPRAAAAPALEKKATAAVAKEHVTATVSVVAAAAPRSQRILRKSPSFDGGVFDPASFHWELTAILCELVSDRNVAEAVNKVRVQHVPEELQAKEFADIITRAAEESRGPNRRSVFAFAAGLAASTSSSAFVRAECLIGTKIFFQQIYQDLLPEVPRLDAIASAEIVPTLRSVFTESELLKCVPAELLVTQK